MANTIITKNSSTASAVPTAGDLVQGELAVNVTDKRLFTEDAGGNIVEIGTNPSTINIDAGTIDGTAIGGTTPAAGSFTTLSASGNVTLSGGTANGVPYLNGSKVLTSGSALTFDGSNLTQSGANAAVSLQVNTANAGVSASNYSEIQLADVGTVRSYWRSLRDGSGATIFSGNDHIRYALLGSEKMRLTSTGLGIGTSSPGKPLHVYNTTEATVWAQSTTGYGLFRASSTGGDFYLGIDNSTGAGFGAGNYGRLLYSTGAYPISFFTNATKRMELDSSGNLGLGVTPSAATTSTIQLPSNTTISGAGSAASFAQNAVYNTGWKYITTAGASLYQGYQGDHYWFTAPSGTAGNAISFSQVMTLDANGNLGIGTSSPAELLHVSSGAGGTVDSTLRLSTSSTRYWNLTANAYNAGTNTYDFTIESAAYAGNIIFKSNSTERARIDSSGKLLIGVTSAVDTGSGIKILPADGTDTGRYDSMSTSTSTRYRMAYFTNGSLVGSITTNGSLTAYNTLSDYRLKQDWVAVSDASTRVKALKPVNFAWKVDGKRVDGFLAHELAEVVPEAATGEKDAVDADGNPVYQGIDQSKLVPLLTAALQEALSKIESLESRLTAAGL